MLFEGTRSSDAPILVGRLPATAPLAFDFGSHTIEAWVIPVTSCLYVTENVSWVMAEVVKVQDDR